MSSFSRKQIAITGGIFLVLVAGILVFVLLQGSAPEVVPEEPAPSEEVIETAVREVIGTSVEGRAIEAFTYGTGGTQLVFVGGIHGGYEWNSVLLAYEFIDHLKAHPETVPSNMQVTVIPNANPDGVFAVIKKEGRFTLTDVPSDEGVVGTGRFNARDVDLNRNFDCKWAPTSMWRSNTVSAGTAAFSEPEAKAIRDFALLHEPDAFIFWHSQANAVYASECEAGILPETLTLMNTYATAAAYPTVDTFDAYPITGDAEGWLASIGIPAITVELATHQTLEWTRNFAGIEALLEHYENKE